MSDFTHADADSTTGEPLLQARDVKQHYPIKEGILRRQTGTVRAVDGVDIDIYPGDTHAIVGESGCGKSTLLETLLGLEEPTDGTISYEGTPFSDLSGSEKRALKSEIQIVFQNPESSLDPRNTIGQIISEPLHLHTDASTREIDARVVSLLDDVGLGPRYYGRYPHELSGGQQQRVAIARAISLNPTLLFLDEPTSALDVSVQSKILRLLDEIKDEYDLTYVMVTHDLSVVRHFATDVSVMYLGNIIEKATTDALFTDPKHPYTQALISAVPVPNPHHTAENDITLPGTVPEPSDPPSGCRFHPRCPIATDECAEDFPDFESHEGHDVRCIRIPEAEDLGSTEGSAVNASGENSRSGLSATRREEARQE
ncbi:ABC transporter ATP-binding protein [Halobellus clavatus]|mgnify:CR=1 FL=1|uniref:Peptide/nickel transport system ATP-binding protein n=1 Tax=Halobellus clavatus TaxID=660517 RepID=A0A1H3IDS3_9EURY|nr:oligopeptide/dipeptide ABC transporter ATP-binding protein [Halobellus clavatus]SDY25856.1 peptide/nickel transport system ATP-binding protein [Halobellus clavatus]